MIIVSSSWGVSSLWVVADRVILWIFVMRVIKCQCGWQANGIVLLSIGWGIGVWARIGECGKVRIQNRPQNWNDYTVHTE
jgi:hypothetical protein